MLPNVDDVIGRLTDDGALNRLAYHLMQHPEWERFAFIQAILASDQAWQAVPSAEFWGDYFKGECVPLVVRGAVILANRCLRRRTYCEQIFTHVLLAPNSRCVQYVLYHGIPRLGYRHVLSLLVRLVTDHPEAIARVRPVRRSLGDMIWLTGRSTTTIREQAVLRRLDTLLEQA